MATQRTDPGQTIDRVPIVHQNLLARVEARDLPPGPPPAGPLTPDDAVRLFQAQCLSRALDIEARAMQKAGTGFYTIGSSGHEGMAAVAHALRPTDMAFLHYRDAAFQIARADQVPGQSALDDFLLSFACSSEDPISGGRHKVLGSKALNIPPQTSTIASHLPKAVGAAYSIGAAKRHRPEHSNLPDDALIMASFGDASANHATAQSAFNAASWAAYQSSPMPMLFVCEDNGIGISVKTPRGWIEAAFATRPELRYIAGDGLDLYDAHRAATEAADYVRTTRRPAFLHLRTVRLFGHAGADVPTSYLSRTEVEQQEADDPLLHSIRLLDEAGVLSADQALDLYQETCARVSARATEAAAWPRLETSSDVMRSLIPPPRHNAPTPVPDAERRAAIFGGELTTQQEPQPMGRLLNWALTDVMMAHPEVVIMGEDVGQKGGVYGVTQRLLTRFGPDRVIDTLLDETSILGLAIGMAHNGFVPIPEIQFLAYLHNAEDQIRGEAATLPFFSGGQYTNPMVVRVAGLGYQRGFGGHFHNDNSLAVLRDIPGLVLVCPSDGAEAACLLREAVRLAREEQRLVVFLEPIALYPMRDRAEGDGGWLRHYPAPDERIEFGSVGVAGEGTDLAIVTFGNGVRLSHQAAAELGDDGVAARVVDLRWLSPLPTAALLDAIDGCNRILVVDETRASGGVSEGVVTALAEAPSVTAPVARLASDDSFIATGPAYAATMPSVERIVDAARALGAR